MRVSVLSWPGAPGVEMDEVVAWGAEVGTRWKQDASPRGNGSVRTVGWQVPQVGPREGCIGDGTADAVITVTHLRPLRFAAGSREHPGGRRHHSDMHLRARRFNEDHGMGGVGASVRLRPKESKWA